MSESRVSESRISESRSWQVGRFRKWTRSPIVWWALIGCCVALSIVTLSSALAAADASATAWGQTQRVAVVEAPIEVGEAVLDGVVWKDQPTAVVAASAVSALSPDQVARFPLAVGEVVLAGDIVVGGAALAQTLPPGTAALTLPKAAGWPELDVGDRVDLIATFPVGDTTTGGPATQRVSRGAVVVDLDEGLVTIAVPEEEVTTVAHALARAVILAVLVPLS